MIGYLLETIYIQVYKELTWRKENILSKNIWGSPPPLESKPWTTTNHGATPQYIKGNASTNRFPQ